MGLACEVDPHDPTRPPLAATTAGDLDTLTFGAAMAATAAAPELWDPVAVGDSEFVDGSLSEPIASVAVISELRALKVCRLFVCFFVCVQGGGFPYFACQIAVSRHHGAPPPFSAAVQP